MQFGIMKTRLRCNIPFYSLQIKTFNIETQNTLLFSQIVLSGPLQLSTHSINDNVRHAWLYECAIGAMQKKMKLNSDDVNSGSKKYKEDYDVACGGV
jgi:hypothetical protein